MLFDFIKFKSGTLAKLLETPTLMIDFVWFPFNFPSQNPRLMSQRPAVASALSHQHRCPFADGVECWISAQHQKLYNLLWTTVAFATLFTPNKASPAMSFLTCLCESWPSLVLLVTQSSLKILQCEKIDLRLPKLNYNFVGINLWPYPNSPKWFEGQSRYLNSPTPKRIEKPGRHNVKIH